MKILKTKVRDKNRRESLLKQGLCAGHPSARVDDGKSRCRKCLDNTRDRARKNKEAGFCTTHPTVLAVSGYSTCNSCREYDKIRRHNQKVETMNAYGGLRCACNKCPVPEPGLAFLSIDHINNNGAEHRKQVKEHMSFWLKKNGFPPGFQVLCHNCNQGKRINGGICPHLTGD